MNYQQNGHSRGPLQLSRRPSSHSPSREKLTGRVEDLDTLSVGVTHEDVSLTGHRHPLGICELSLASSPAPHGHHEVVVHGVSAGAERVPRVCTHRTGAARRGPPAPDPAGRPGQGGRVGSDAPPGGVVVRQAGDLEGTVLDVLTQDPDPHPVATLTGQAVHDLVLSRLPRLYLHLDQSGQSS